MLTRIHHVGIAVADLEESIRLYRAALGAELIHRASSEKEGLEAAFLRAGDGELELLAALREDSPVGKFMVKRGPGLHHVAYAVTDITKALAEARAAGLELIDAEPRMGMHGSLIAFVHPKSLGGVLTEYVEE
ncbi:MAG: methylmalonyl-CoA epimerase [Chloroflexi bacterium]|nr:MAG: methylmalonyl-CoA epimerase [Chloroflexota bacterium]TMC73138.1 MAG: methylmalonyl-CoA epimerase [Chloroflexota bacterium]